MKTVEEEARAKINLWLRILGRRQDGFHELETRLVEVGVADRLRFTEVPRGQQARLESAAEGIPLDESNLILQAVRVFESAVGEPLPVRIELEKRIPHGAGLGGGSSDAAATLRGLNQLFDFGFSRQQLRELASPLGSDIPFFVSGGACDCSGRGEIVKPAVFEEELSLLLVKPWFSVATPWAYQEWKGSQEVEGFSYAPQEFSWGTMSNDLERPVFARHLLLGVMKSWLLSRAEVAGALMSGSGSTMFALTHADLGHLKSEITEQFGPETWVMETQVIGSRLESSLPPSG